MQMRRTKIIVFMFILLLTSFMLSVTLDKSSVGYLFASNGGDIQGQGVYIDITIEDVAVQTLEVKKGDKVTFTVTLKNRGEVTEDSITLRLFSGKRVLTEKIIFPDRWDVKDMAKFDFVWDTKNIAPGNYPLKVEAFMFSDQDSYDNEYDIPGEISIR